MATIPVITADDVAGRLTWTQVTDAFGAGHGQGAPRLGDQFLKRGDEVLLSRAAWIDGVGIGVKSVTVMPRNPDHGLPTVGGAMLVFEDRTGQLRAILDSGVVTNWKTAGDSVLGAKLLARPDSRRLLIVGAGVVASNLIPAYRELFPDLADIAVWNRGGPRVDGLVAAARAQGHPVRRAEDLAAEAGRADIIATATVSPEPVLRGDWVGPGTHVDLIGAFTNTMREADDALLRKARLFVDSRETTIDHIGELMIPIASGAITADAVLGDLYDIVPGRAGRQTPEEITVYKNGGGAHLDLMTAGAILRAVA